jgi:putative MFS transporter
MATTISARLDRLPLSRVHHRLLVIGGLGYTFDGMDAAIVAFLLPELRRVFDLSNGQLGLVGSATPFGFLFGAALAGVLGDRIGRKKVMLSALAIYAVFSVVAALAPSYEVFLGARVLAGLGTGAESAIIAPYLSEFVPAARRGWFVGALAGFFSFGFLAAALIGRFIVPASDQGWRWAQLITAVPILLVLWWRRGLPESPRWLTAQGRSAEADRIVMQMEGSVLRQRGGPLPPVTASHESDQATPSVSVMAGLRYLWAAPMRRRTAVTWLIWFVITFSYYGFFSWIPTLLIDKGITVTKSFTFSIVIYAAQIPGYFSAAWISERIDRKNTIALYLSGSAIAALWLSQMTSPAQILLAGAVLSFFLNGTYAGVYAYTPEVFPTFIRSTGSGLASAFGRVGSIIAPLIIGITAASWGFAGVFGMTTVILVVGVIATLVFAVSTKGRTLEDITHRQADGITS